MKKGLLIIALLSAANSFAQNAEVPNNEFNNWDSDTNPVAWSTMEDAIGAGNGIVQKEQADVRNGAASLKLVTPQPAPNVSYSIVALGGLVYVPGFGLRSTGTAYTSRPDSVWILYKYNSPASDSAAIRVTLATNGNGNPQNILNITYPIPETTEWTVKGYRLASRYQSAAMPDSIYVSLISSASQVKTPNSTLQVDGVYFNNPSNSTTSIRDISAQVSLKLYPNPLAKGAALQIESSESLKGARLHMTDAAGRKTGSYDINRQNAIQLHKVQAGNYFWYITNDRDELIGKGQLSVL